MGVFLNRNTLNCRLMIFTQGLAVKLYIYTRLSDIVSVTKEGRTALSTLDRLKLARAAREEGGDKFTFFESDRKVGEDFRVVYDLYMRLKALSKSIKFYDIHNVFNVLSSKIVLELEKKLDVLFVAQAAVTLSSKALASVPTNTTFATNLTSAKVSEATALLDLEAVDLVSTNLLQNYKGVSGEEVRVSNKYYSHYGQNNSVKNLA